MSATDTQEDTMTYAEALDVLERDEQGQQSLDEMRAEAGMSAVAGGWSGYDGVAVFNAELEERVDPEERAAWRARVAEAERVVAECPCRVVLVTRRGEVWGDGPVRFIARPGDETIPF